MSFKARVGQSSLERKVIQLFAFFGFQPMWQYAIVNSTFDTGAYDFLRENCSR